VILGWNDQTALVLKSLAKGKKLGANEDLYRRPVVVLADRPKADMEKVFREVVPPGTIEVHARR
jgi:hypothetical protein